MQVLFAYKDIFKIKTAFLCFIKKIILQIKVKEIMPLNNFDKVSYVA